MQTLTFPRVESSKFQQPTSFEQNSMDLTPTGQVPGRLLSFVIPVKDEAPTLRILKDRILEHLPSGDRAELILIDDGSTDDSWQEIHDMAAESPTVVRGVRFRRNSGKAAALTAGFRAARGAIVFTLDADLQDDPREIPRFLAKLEEGYDLVSGWKKVRHDPWHKVLPSRVFNAMLSKVCQVDLHDHNCGFKCYRAEVTRNLTLHGELHRMIPSLGAINGFRSAEIPVQHHPRTHGSSKYGFERYLRGFVDMMIVGFLRRFRERPAHFIGGISALYVAIGLLCLLAGLVIGPAIGAGLALILSGVVMVAVSGAVAVAAILSELVIRGGLARQWSLPIVEDTARSFPRNGSADSIRTIPLAYDGLS
ncbi:glycosyltransferase family 2 protein [Tautonia rosea]|uniref:glycosyltransferase family 2 protein n=1 Tax=Tautonia rosea TaxID=2728037 RepID=UPI0014737BA3|nr:glycosyltransferase family 2 protein [Tautonia rosea]